MKTKILVILLFFGLVFVSYLYFTKPAQIVLPYPYTEQNNAGKSDWACKGQISSSIATNEIGTKNLSGNISTSQSEVDSLAISINGNKLKFITGASVNAGSTDDRPLTIVENTDNRLEAYDINDTVTDKPIDAFIMNKKNGLAVWTETLPHLLGSDPYGLVEYFTCY